MRSVLFTVSAPVASRREVCRVCIENRRARASTIILDLRQLRQQQNRTHEPTEEQQRGDTSNSQEDTPRFGLELLSFVGVRHSMHVLHCCTVERPLLGRTATRRRDRSAFRRALRARSHPDNGWHECHHLKPRVELEADYRELESDA